MAPKVALSFEVQLSDGMLRGGGVLWSRDSVEVRREGLGPGLVVEGYEEQFASLHTSHLPFPFPFSPSEHPKENGSVCSQIVFNTPARAPFSQRDQALRF